MLSEHLRVPESCDVLSGIPEIHRQDCPAPLGYQSDLAQLINESAFANHFPLAIKGIAFPRFTHSPPMENFCEIGIGIDPETNDRP